MRVVLVLMSFGLLASCGADGMPMAPASAATAAPAAMDAASGLTMGGTVTVGVAKDGSGS